MNANLLNIGLGEVCPKLSVIFLLLLGSLMGISEAQAQIDVEIEIVMGLPPGIGQGELIAISPNPFSTEVDIAYDDNETTLNELIIKDSSGNTLYILDLTSGTSFNVRLSAGTYYFLIETDSEIITKTVVMSDS